jgi:hypothetical protein
MRRLLACLLFAVTAVAAAQTPQHRDEAATLARRIDWGTYSPKMFQDVDRKITFNLATSWIPGEKHQGMFRYVMTASPEKLSLAQRARASPDPDSLDSIKQLVTRVHDCTITLELYDTDGFVLRKITIPFDFGVDSDANVKALYANDSAQMDMVEYEHFVGSTEKAGGWSVSWLCDPRGPKD